MNAWNQTKNAMIATDVEKAITVFQRMRGLLGKPSIHPSYGLWISPCKSIHTFFMRFSIDVIFLSKSNHVIELMESVSPFRVSRWVANAKSVLELAPHSIKNSRTDIGDQVIFQ